MIYLSHDHFSFTNNELDDMDSWATYHDFRRYVAAALRTGGLLTAAS